MRRTEDPILSSIRRARGKSVSDARKLKPIPPALPPESVPAPHVETAPPPEEPETVTLDPEENVRDIKTDETMDKPPEDAVTIVSIEQPFGLDWILRR